MLEILPKGKGPIVICPARAVEGMKMPKGRGQPQAVQQDRLLLVTMFFQRTERVTEEDTLQRNLLVTGLASERILFTLR